MPNRCVVYGCSNTANSAKGIALHKIPFWGDSRPEAKKRRKVWTTFVSTKCAKWKPSEGSRVCSKHFKPSDFVVQYPNLTSPNSKVLQRLKQDDFGVCVYPTVQSVVESSTTEPAMSAERDRRMVSGTVLYIDVYNK